MRDWTTVTIRVTRDEHRRLKRIAAEYDASLSWVLRRIVLRALRMRPGAALGLESVDAIDDRDSSSG